MGASNYKMQVPVDIIDKRFVGVNLQDKNKLLVHISKYLIINCNLIQYNVIKASRYL